MVKDINWNAVSAVGQWAGAIATVAAVIIALRQSKPKIRIRAFRDGVYECDPSTLKALRHIGKETVVVTNVGMQGVEIGSVGIKMPYGCSTTVENELKKLPAYLKPGEKVSLEFDLHAFNQEIVETLCAFYAIDSSGQIHYQEANIIIKVFRFLWWNLGRYTKKYYKYYKESKL